MFHFFVVVEPYMYVYLVLIIRSFICICKLKLEFVFSDIKTKAASAGNRAGAARVAGEHSTNEPPMLICMLGMACTYKDPRLA